MIHQRHPREHDREYLALIRSAPCVGCDQDPAGEAAHLRLSAEGEPPTGVGIKPHDRLALPLCAHCHRKQHSIGERTFWRELGIDPWKIAAALYEARDDLRAMRTICFRAREDRA